VKRKQPRFGKGFRVVLGNRCHKLRAGTLLLIERGDELARGRR
jgi:hypothetical protein